MPYRRLPNTDAARLRALRIALEMGKNLPPQKLAFKPGVIPALEKILHNFEQSIKQYHQALGQQNKRSHNYFDVMKKARVYITHFVRVMNMAVFRGELPPQTRTFYGLTVSDANVPSLNTENEILSWGRRIIEGEEFRIRKGGNPVSNPSIALVKIRHNSFAETCAIQQNLEKKSLDLMDQNQKFRSEADKLILRIWNEIEETHKALPEKERRSLNEMYGVKYFFRKKELAAI